MERDLTNDTLSYRRALEALRNGVPNKDAVTVLGCNQPEVEREFAGLMARVENVADRPDSGLGILVRGDFGTGKSHLLEYLEDQALKRNFLCSRVVISKETPLFNLEKVFQAAIDNGRMPGVTGPMIEEIALKLDPKSEGYAGFYQWANSLDNGLSRIFPATLMVHERLRDDPAFLNEIEGFWSGERMPVARVRAGLRAIGQLHVYNFRGQSARQLPPQRLRFVLELIKGAGYSGWVVLMDEIELVAKYSILQRGRSYAELARWMGQVSDEAYPGLIVVGTVTAPFATEVLVDKEDRDKVVPRLRARQTDESNITAARAESGMRMIERDERILSEPDDENLRTTYDHLKHIYTEGYAWPAPEIEHGIGRGGRRRMRSYVRRWINEWDLRRLYPDARPDIEETEFNISYVEDKALERESPEDSNDAVSEDSSQ